ncbi:hypothetical protein EIP91_006500 [Steccherinum ochraceum]|uniref:TEA domain-containing protein n=1 Tax=Steccherinum ochraceum TaxID=92696 RepID=A0A4R0RR80_9APHY|nr:hypothetical protein EIP91_006500 [Steccherinum ochraceum]
MSDAFLSSLKSLTPQRKHHKLLKDGNEVWSEDVEKIFVQGLKDYWESPWATYSRGRSRWRNQFLVDHLKKHGIERSKKQVASHIQVLRNMWRGSPEFHLVAGGEELFQEDGLLASPKKAGTPSTPGSGSDGMDDQETSASSTPSSVAAEFPTAQLPSSISLPHFMPSEDLLSSHSSIDPFAIPSSASAIALPYSLGPSSPSSSRNRPRHGSVKLEPLHMGPGLFNLPHSPPGGVTDNDLSPLFPPFPAPPQVRLLSLSLWAEGMQPFTADIDALNATIPLSSHKPKPRASSFASRWAAVTFSDLWMSEAKCITKSCMGSDSINQEVGFLEVSPHSGGAITCILPESSLSRCKWLPLEQDQITQQIAIDGVIVAAFVYHIERTLPGSPPSVELVDFQKYKPQSRRGTHSQHVLPTPGMSTHPSTPPAGASSSSSGFHHNPAFPSTLMPMDYAASSDPHAYPHATLMDTYTSFGSPNSAPPMFRTDSSPPQLTATTSASMIFGSPR